jgi:hypothetical protein
MEVSDYSMKREDKRKEQKRRTGVNFGGGEGGEAKE